MLDASVSGLESTRQNFKTLMPGIVHQAQEFSWDFLTRISLNHWRQEVKRSAYIL